MIEFINVDFLIVIVILFIDEGMIDYLVLD